MYYYVIYDMNDNIIALCETEEEVLDFTSIRKDHLRDRIKKGFCYYRDDNEFKKIYRFEV